MRLRIVISFIMIFFILLRANAQIDSNKEVKTDMFNYQPDNDINNNQKKIETPNSLKYKGETITLFGTLSEIAENLPKYNIIQKERKRKMSDFRKKDDDLLVKKYWNGQNVSVNKINTQLELGRINTNSRNIRIECRDHSYVDGDRVRLYVNDVVVRSNIVLSGGYYLIDIKLNDGF